MTKPIVLIKRGLNVAPLKAALTVHQEVWNTNTTRTAPSNSPHKMIDDIWVRFAPDHRDSYKEHTAVWYDVANILPVKELADEVLSFFPGKLGGILITRVPAGKLVLPHTDGGWHAANFHKIGVSVAANQQQAFCFDDTFLRTDDGDAFWFDNSKPHWVQNVSDQDRITCIICIQPQEV